MKKILLIEDDLVMRENTAEILELSNYKVVTAENGKVGVKKAMEEKPDLIICDIMMPELDGYGVLQVLSKNPQTSCIPFIFLTAKAEKSEMRKGMELGADDYLSKPYEDTELLSAIETRFKKFESVRKEYSQDLEGVDEFFDSARGQKELENLSKERHLTSFKKKQVIYNEGDQPEYLYFLNEGKVKVYKTHDDGKEYVTNVFKEGEFFGVHSLFDEKAYSDTAIVLEESKICKIPKEDFLSLLYKNRDVSTQFIKMLSNSIEEKEKQLLSFAYDTVRKRVAEALVSLQRQYKKNEEEETHIKVTRDDLAAMAGTATETTIRCLSEFKTDGFIEIKGREIIIVKPKELESIRY